ncbi:PREDICTED: stomatin-like protein 2, mitochondrial [Dufourea novaeangliae]|uniref:stomatin-like protein 2, mitochondrial n=1 Tax=Dufourea novaeangliae TaxID=178035 RepID=UPI00076746E2|nr:PREDICTED: stomatin-like protein 2, mitochondrial [Dufourea novaeangliae]
MLLQQYRGGMNCRFKLLARNFGIVKAAHGIEHAAPNVSITTARHKSFTPLNTVIMFVPQQEAWIVERMGKFHKILEPGINILLPIVDRIKYVQCLKEIAIEIPQQGAVTTDNVTINIDGVLYLRVNDPYRASVCIVESINKASEAWGITCLRYEIRDIRLPQRVQEAMQMQVEAERKKRAAILESEGVREADINIAEGKRLAQILASEAAKQEEINKASGAATALVAVAEARAKSLKAVASALNLTDAKNAAALSIAEQYVKAFNKLAKNSNTLILPSNVADVSSLVTQALTIYKQVMSQSNIDESQIKASANSAHNTDNSDEAFEYFSDKEEAQKHIESGKHNPHML